MMRRIAGAGCALLVGCTGAWALGKLAPAEIQTTFFNGQPFTASTPTGIKFKMIFTTDGKVTREPLGKVGIKGDGTWKLSKDGFCTTWKGSKAGCFAVVGVEDNKWSIVKGATTVATWSK
jgi:hypothetical protein